jgi:tRNA nucleotidyltransferase (CCA-adding enzyme)
MLMIREVLKRITPTIEEKKVMEDYSRHLIVLIKNEFKGTRYNVDVNVYGSVSRGTWLSYEKDIDVFVSFPIKFSKKELEDAVTKIGMKILKNVEKRFAEHPYVRGQYDGLIVEIVPCYAVKGPSERVSAVDRTPFHDDFVKRNLKGKQDEVRLLKQFLKGIDSYGAEARVEGFSGYLCELLIIYFGSLEGIQRAAENWQSPVVIDIRGGSSKDQFLPAPLIFIDPTDSNRNVASALSKQKFSLFIHAAKEYLKSPNLRFFFPKKRDVSRDEVVERFRSRGTHVLSISFKTPGVIDDILFSQLRKTKRFLEKKMTDFGFSSINTGFIVKGNATLFFEIENMELPSSKLHWGPPQNSKNIEDFLKKHRGSSRSLTNPFLKSGRWAVFLKREHTNAGDFLTSFLSLNELKKKGVPSHIASALSKGFEIAINEVAIKENLEFFADLFDPLFPWEIGND